MALNMRVIPASPGDSILISYDYKGETKNILIDGGIGETYYTYLKEILLNIKSNNQYVDLLVLTHVDYDHIEGIIRIFEDTEIDKDIIKKVWFNSGELLKKYFDNTSKCETSVKIENEMNIKESMSQGITLEKKLKGYTCYYKELIMAPNIFEDIPGVKITVLSPDIDALAILNNKWEVEIEKSTKMSYMTDYNKSLDDLIKNKFVEDKSIPNRSSIAFMLEHANSRLLFLGDSWPSVITNSLKRLGYSKENKLSVNVVKVAHHGSKRNTNEELLSLINCKNYIISSDATTHGLPNKECIAKIINANPNVNIYFNYQYIQQKGIFTMLDKERYDFKYIEMMEDNPYTINGEVTLWI